MNHLVGSMYLHPENSAEPSLRHWRSPWPESRIVFLVAFYMACSILRPWEVMFPFLAQIHFERMLAVIVLLVVVSRCSFRPIINFQSFAILAFMSAIGLSSVFAVNPSSAWEQFYKYSTLVVIYVAIIMAIKSAKALIFVVNFYIVTMTIYLAKSQWEFFFHGRRHYRMGVGRLLGVENTLGGPNELAMSVIASLPFLLFLWVFRNEISGGWSPVWRRWYGRLLVAYGLLALTSVVLTNSRSGMLGFILFILFAAFSLGVSDKKHVRALIGVFMGVVMLLAVVWIIMPKENQNRFQSIWDTAAAPQNAQVSAQGRVDGFWAGMQMFNRFPVTGVGPGNFIEYRTKHGDGTPLNAHNLFGQVLGETGILGGATFLVLVGTIVGNARRLKRIGQRSADLTVKLLAALGGAIRGSVYLLLFEGLFGHNLFRFNWLWLAAFSVLALEYALRQVRDEGRVVVRQPSSGYRPIASW
jgi:O-antigen ligase